MIITSPDPSLGQYPHSSLCVHVAENRLAKELGVIPSSPFPCVAGAQRTHYHPATTKTSDPFEETHPLCERLGPMFMPLKTQRIASISDLGDNSSEWNHPASASA